MNNKKNFNSIMLMILGVIFVVIAGGIFITTAWEYIPGFMKTLFLLVISFGFFCGSILASKNEKLKITCKVLFYLGSIFLGFFIVGATGGLQIREMELNSLRLWMATMVVAIPIMMNYVKRKSVFEWNVLIVLLDLSMIFLSICLKIHFSYYVIIFICMIFVMSIYLYFLKENREGSVIEGSLLIQIIVHQIMSILFCFILVFCQLIFLFFQTEENFLNESKLLCIMLLYVMISGLLYYTYKAKILRILNSFMIYFCTFSVFIFLLGVGNDLNEWRMIIFVSFAMNMFISVSLFRKEMLYMNVMFAYGISVLQILNFLFWYEYSLSGQLVNDNFKVTYYPYLVILIVGMLLVYLRLKWKNEEKQEFRKKLLYLSGLQLLVASLIWISASKGEGLLALLFGIQSVACVSVAVMIRDELIKKVLNTGAISFGIVTCLLQEFIMIPKAYMVEWNVFIITVGLFIIGRCWNCYRIIRWSLQFGTVCFMLFVLLMNNLVNPNCSIINVLILGVLAFVILIISLKKNNKEYAIAASITLGLMAFYMTRDFWLSIAWWVYLFVVGIFFILLAIKKERAEN